MKCFTWIKKGNDVHQFNYLSEIKGEDKSDAIVIDDTGVVIVNQGNPITWPADATDGMQAIVDVKAGTLRFAYDGWPRAHTEFVVSEYVEPFVPFVSVEDCDPVHVLDLIKEWPNPEHPAFLQGKVFDDWRWLHLDSGGRWVLRNDKENVEFHEGHWLNYHENKKKQAVPHIFDLSTPVQPKVPMTKEEVMTLVDVWPHDDTIPVNRDITDNWIWTRKDNKNVIINLVDNVNSGVVVTENDWRKYLPEELRKYPPIIETKHDPVNRPSHYTAGGIECIDAIKASMSTEAFLGFLKGNVQKYIWRYEKKVAPVEDLKKAQWYLSKLIEEQERS